MSADWVGGDGAPTARRYAEMATHVASVSPSYERLCLGVASDPDVLERLDTLPTAKRQPNLLLGAVRLLGGPVDDYGAFGSFARTRWDELAAIMLTHRTQTNEPRRLATLLPVLATLSQPLALLEVGASAGLCLYPDRYGFRYDGGPLLGNPDVVLECTTEGPVPLPTTLPEIAWRGGLDLNPLDIASSDDTRWLESLIWPEETERFEIFRAACEIARQEPADIVGGDLTRDLVAAARRVPSGTTLVVFHSAVLAYVDAQGRAAFRAQLAEIGAERPMVWVSNEVPGVVVGADEVDPGGASQVRPNEFVLAVDGDPVACTDGHGAHLRWPTPEWSVGPGDGQLQTPTAWRK